MVDWFHVIGLVMVSKVEKLEVVFSVLVFALFHPCG